MFLRCCVLFAGVCWMAGAPEVRALDFQVQSIQVEEDGYKHEQPFLRNDEHTRIFLTLPAGWDRTAEPNALTLSARAENETTIRLEKSPLTPDLPFKEKGLDAYRQRALASVPQGATEVQVSVDLDEPLPIFHWKSHEFVVDYVFFGRAFRRSQVFLDLNATEQILMTTVAPKAGFDRAHEAAFDVLRSWQVMPVR